MKIIAIHQPNFFPWLGYFDKMFQSDVFVLLDHVQSQKTGGTWTNRVKLLIGGEARWVTAPVMRNFHGLLSVKDLLWCPDKPWRVKMLKNLSCNYSRAPFFQNTMEWLEPLVLNPERNVSLYNSTAIIEIARRLGISTKKILLSSNMHVEGHATEMLIELTRKAGCHTYLCGGGAHDYQNEASFAVAGIKLLYQNFHHPVYLQTVAKHFVPGLSIIDALMYLGVSGVRFLLLANLESSS